MSRRQIGEFAVQYISIVSSLNSNPSSDVVMRVVLIEDLREVREGLAALINGTAGYKCVAAYSMMETALTRIEKDSPDLILTDLGLPGMSGIEGIEKLRALLANYRSQSRLWRRREAGSAIRHR